MSEVEFTPIPMSPDDVFGVLANSRRRQVILSLSESDGPVSARDLSVEIAATEELIDPTEVSSEQRTRIYISLLQSHLGQLDDVGAVEYDERSKEVAPTKATTPLAKVIRRITSACYDPVGDSDD